MNKRALVIGGGTIEGIGFATATALARDGADVAIMDLDADLANQAAAALEEAGSRTLGLGGDASEESDVAGAVARVVSEWGGLDILVNNVGVSLGGDVDVAGMDAELWDATMRLNLRPALLGCKHAIPPMRAAGGGAIVNTSSTASLFGSTGISAYGAAKAAVNALTKSVATQNGKHGIRCNAVIPGFIDTPTGRRKAGETFRELMLENILMPRIGTPEDIAHLVAFLASDRAEWLTGQLIAIDGGLSCHAPQLASIRRGFGDGGFLAKP